MSETRDHEDGMFCWCNPTLYYQTESGSPIWLHYGPEDKVRREPPGLQMVEVIAELAWQDAEGKKAS